HDLSPPRTTSLAPSSPHVSRPFLLPRRSPRATVSCRRRPTAPGDASRRRRRSRNLPCLFSASPLCLPTAKPPPPHLLAARPGDAARRAGALRPETRRGARDGRWRTWPDLRLWRALPPPPSPGLISYGTGYSCIDSTTNPFP
uniref:Uncharacterized protein n=1 Tax=Triticum urartu TaxID=4572 RepID=A0A8R7UF92_TRIUA